jgi:hypothetical protein
MDVNNSLNRLNFQSEMVALAIIAIALLLILHLNRGQLQLRLRDWRLRHCLSRIGSEQIRDLVCADGLDGYYTIDRLALTGDSILLISYKPYVGNIFCAQHISEWTQLLGQKSFKFENPLFEMENQLTALKQIVGDVPLHGFLFFNQNAAFPKGHPPSVLQPDSIPPQFLHDQVIGVKANVRVAWDRLKVRQANGTTPRGLSVKT